MLAVAIRIAQCMGMHDESSYVRYTSLEAEIRRRLWWSLIIFDHRICEISNYKITTLTPTWDRKTPLNVSDFEMFPDVKSSLASHEKPTEAVFIVVRSELADFVRHSASHLNFINPSLNTMAQSNDTWHGLF
jgi:Fungal specific transcription factor domain.